jgi:hypothetical protein
MGIPNMIKLPESHVRQQKAGIKHNYQAVRQKLLHFDE